MAVVYTIAAAVLAAVFALGYTAGFHDVGWRLATWRRRHRTTRRRPVTDLPLPDTEPVKEPT